MVKKLIISASILLAAVSCGGPGKPSAPVYRSFPLPDPAPMMVTDEAERIAYSVNHFWDKYFAEQAVTDSAAVLGVKNDDIEKSFATYVSLLNLVPMDVAVKSTADLFRRIEAKQAENDSSLFYLRFTEIVSKYLYDPNSPVRNEDFYLPMVKGMAASRFTSEDMVPAYEYEARMCALNPYGSKVADFKFKDINGRVHSLYGIRATYTILFFSNPYCTNCKEIMDEFRSLENFNWWISAGDLAIASIYIDRELDEWREYQPNYPKNWITGYDYNYIIREDVLYNVRAIPSLYLLDAEKRVILKDAPQEQVIQYLARKLQNR